ncbi:molybdopterin-guanine dinucleotide biosynthesis protein MobC [Salmonella enterica]|nr:molybdopterin-guanine dinucleotide biosynthesis protein MobC [Salmonella enterica]
MTTTKQNQKWFTRDDIELAKQALSELPDLTEKRLTRNDALQELKAQIIELAEKKGYSADDIKSALEGAGIPAGLKAIREIMATRKTPRRSNTRSSRKDNNMKPESNDAVGFSTVPGQQTAS